MPCADRFANLSAFNKRDGTFFLQEVENRKEEGEENQERTAQRLAPGVVISLIAYS
jgi:hypothetical protein